jgi:16S rRNA (adenine1518-N6/adenine1519-N6)-dimethyltransferase
VNLQPRARRELGQNFLVDRQAVVRIVDAVVPRSGEPILEIGPGRGALTDALLTRVDRMAVIERDAALVDGLRRDHSPDRLVVFHDDVRRVELASIAPALGQPRATRLVVVGNLPYNISKPIAMKLIRERRSIDRAVLMFQKEVADRLTALPGSKAYGPLTVLAGLTYCVEQLFDLRPGAFRPRPKVDSTVTRWHTREVPGFDEQSESALRACLAASFGRRRQTLRNNLRSALRSSELAEKLLESAELDGSLRAEAISPEAFVRLAHHWPGAA